MDETNGSFVASNETYFNTTVSSSNVTDNVTEQIHTGEPVHEDDSTVSVVLIPLLIIGLLVAVTAIVSLLSKKLFTF